MKVFHVKKVVIVSKTIVVHYVGTSEVDERRAKESKLHDTIREKVKNISLISLTKYLWAAYNLYDILSKFTS